MRYGNTDSDTTLAELAGEIVRHLRAGAAISGFWANTVGQEEARRWIFQQLDSSDLFAFAEFDSISSDCMGVARATGGPSAVKETLKFDDLTFEVRRSKRRKTIGLSVERDASLVAYLPEAAALEEASSLIKARLVWVYQKLATHAGSPGESVFEHPEFVDGEGFYFLGRHYRLKLVDPDPAFGPVATVRFVGDRLLFRRDRSGSGEQRIAEHYSRAAHPFLNDAVARWKPIVGAEPALFVNVMDLGVDGALAVPTQRSTSMASHATASTGHRLHRVHNLTHLRVRDHSPEFWRQVRRTLPNYKQYRDWLREKGGVL